MLKEEDKKTTPIIEYTPEEQATWDYVTDRIHYMKDAKQDYLTDWQILEDLYTDQEGDKTEGVNNINFHMGFTHVQAKLSEEIANQPKAEYVEVQTEDIPRRELLQAVHDHEWVKSKSDVELHNAYLSKNVLGTGIMYSTWEVKRRKVYEAKKVDRETGEITKWEEKLTTVYDGIKNYNIDLRNFYPNENAISFDTMPDCYWEEEIDYSTFETYFCENDIYKNTEYVIEGREIDDTYENHEEGKRGKSPRDRVVLGRYYNVEKDSFVVLANDILIQETHLPPHKMLPFSRFVDYSEMNSFYGRGELEILKKVAMYKNKFVNMLLDQAEYSVYKPMIIPENLQFSDYPDQTFTMHAGLVLPVSDPNGVKWMDTPPVGGDAYNVADMITTEAIVMTGVDPKSVYSEPGNRTAFEEAAKKESQIKRISAGQKINECDGLQRLFELNKALIQYYYTKKRAASVTDDVAESGYKRVGLKGYKIVKDGGQIKKLVKSEGALDYFEATPDIIEGPIDVKVVPQSTLAVSKALEGAKIIQYIQSITPLLSHPDAQGADIKTLLQESAKAIGLNPDRVWKEENTKDPDKENEDLLEGKIPQVEQGENHFEHIRKHKQLQVQVAEEMKAAREMLDKFPEDEDRQTEFLFWKFVDKTLKDHIMDTLTEIKNEMQPELAQRQQMEMGMQGQGMQQGMGQMRVPSPAAPKQGLGQQLGESINMQNVR